MATGLVGQASGLGTISYTPQTNAKVVVFCPSYNNQYLFSINGAPAYPTAAATNANGYFSTNPFWVGAGQTLTVTGTSPNTATFFVSALES